MTKTVSIGPIRIPREHKRGLEQLKVGKPHITYSDLVREAIYLFLVKEGVIIVPDRTILKSTRLSGRTEDVVRPTGIIKGEIPSDD